MKRILIVAFALTATLFFVGAILDAAYGSDALPMRARDGVGLAASAARAWAPDAVLTYVENDEPLGLDGSAQRWGYLFHSPTMKKARCYSVEGGKIEQAIDLDLRFEAPPVAEEWVDSPVALAAAEEKAGTKFRLETQASLSSMLLVRGGLDDKDPNRTTWMLVYTAPDVPALFVVVDAASGNVKRVWRG
jgi:hypothetical protein